MRSESGVVAAGPAIATEVPPPRSDEAERDKILPSVAFSFQAGAAVDDGKEAGYFSRFALEAGVDAGVGKVGIFVGALVAGADFVLFDDNRASVAYPALLIFGVHDDDWLLQIAGGASLGGQDQYGEDPTIWTQPSPRAELRGGYRANLIEDRIGVELFGNAGVERRVFDLYDDETRFFVTAGVGLALR